MTLEAEVLQELEAKPASGGAIVERLQGRLQGRAVLVFGALANLREAGRAEPVAVGDGEVVWGTPGCRATPPRPIGPPASFGMGEDEMRSINRELARMTAGLPQHYFEELRRAVVSDADRRTHDGEAPGRAARAALEALGPPSAVRGFLRRVERGGRVKLRLRGGLRWRLVLVPVILVLALVLVRLFVVDVYTVPDHSISMAPALFPSAEGGDALVVVHKLAYRFGAPERGDIAVFHRDDGRTLVKRVWGLPGETVEIRKGDLFADGVRLVKERPLLDRVKVPLGGFETTPQGRRAEAHGGFRLPNGRVEGRDRRDDCTDVVVEGVVTLTGRVGSLTITVDEGNGAIHTLALTHTEGSASVEGIETAHGIEFRLDPDRPRALWLTNADRVFRVELDGREVARAGIRREGGRAVVTVVLDGDVRIDGLTLARDLVHEAADGGVHRWPVGDGEVFVLGDNSPQSHDSRQLGPVPLEDLVGRAWAVAWPPSRIRLLR